MRFPILKVGTRLGLGFALLLLLLTVITVIGIGYMAQIQQRLNHVIHVNNAETKLVLEMRSTLSDRLISLRNMALTNEAALGEAEEARIKAQGKTYATHDQSLQRMLDGSKRESAEKRALLEKVREQEKAALPLMDKAAGLARSLKVDEAARVLMTDLEPLQKNWRAALGELLALEERLNETAAAEAAGAYDQARLFMLLLGGLSLLAGIVTALRITRGLQRQLGGEPADAAAIAGQIAAGNLAVAIDLKADDQGSLLFAIRSMRDQLAIIVGEVRSGADTIATASNQIVAGNRDMTARTELQASSLEETVSSVEELTVTVKQNADNARQANVLAASASEVAVKGGAVVSQVVGTMASIHESARKIVDIIGVIDSLAFQTNILALNAAVEAARAGEQGRGFAVVAAEVRNLAQRSAAAAREIAALINDSVEKVDMGSALVDQAGSTMEDVVESIGRVTAIMNEIAAASQEQSVGIEQINKAVGQIDEVTQRNLVLAEEAAAASQSLHGRAGSLAHVVSVFKLKGKQDMPAGPAGIVNAAPRKSASVMRLPKTPVHTRVDKDIPSSSRGVTRVANGGMIISDTV
jgi:methyl-accepting chemotaxis protein